MRGYRRRRTRRHGGNNGSFWLSFSDLMSSLVLIIILVMFYFIYLYFNQAEQNAIKIEAQRSQLSLAQTELSTKQSELEEAQAKVTAQQLELSAKETEIAEQQALLAAAQETLSTQQATLEAQQNQIEELVGMRTQIISQLSGALKNNDISATVDPATGSITLQSDVMFEVGSSVLSEKGKAFIDQFLPVYLNVLFDEDNIGYISEIIIEGHADQTGTYIDNMKLSQERAFAVSEYIFTSCSAVTESQKQSLQKLLTVNGRSNSDPVYVNGFLNYPASRRVMFEFRLTDEKMISQLQRILESNDENTKAPAAEPVETAAPDGN